MFVDDRQVLPFLNPATQGIALDRRPDSYDSDGFGVLKLAFKDLGEIDFICASHITVDPTASSEIRGRLVALETPGEIIAKKIFYRGWNFQPRDMFDLAAVVERCGVDDALAAVRQCGRERCQAALDTIEKANPIAIEAINAQLMLRDTARHLAGAAQGVSRDLLRRAISEARA